MALRDDPSISKETIATVRTVAAELGYHPAQNDSARRLIARRHGTRVLNKVVALFMPSRYSSVNYFLNIFQGVQETLADEEFALLLVSPKATTDQIVEQGLPEIFTRDGVDGVIDVGFGFTERRKVLFTTPQLADLPTVVLLWPSPHCGLVKINYEAGAYSAAHHLLTLGHRSLLQYLSFQPSELEPERVAGTRRALAEFGLAPDHHLHFLRLHAPWLATDWMKRRSRATSEPEDIAHRQELLALLRAHPEVTGILAWNDIVAREISYTLTEAGLRVPEEISLIGFDDTDAILDDLGQNQLTSVHIPLYEIGCQAASLLMQQIRQPHETQYHTITLPTELMVRNSTTTAYR